MPHDSPDHINKPSFLKGAATWNGDRIHIDGAKAVRIEAFVA